MTFLAVWMLESIDSVLMSGAPGDCTVTSSPDQQDLYTSFPFDLLQASQNELVCKLAARTMVTTAVWKAVQAEATDQRVQVL